MPIRREHRHFYPIDWKQLSTVIRFMRARSLARMKALDALNGKFGCGTVTYASMGRKSGWKLRTEFVSRRYTTRWDDLLAV